MVVNAPAWFVALMVGLCLAVLALDSILKHLNSKYSVAEAQRKVELRTLDHKILKLEIVRLRILRGEDVKDEDNI